MLTRVIFVGIVAHAAAACGTSEASTAETDAAARTAIAATQRAWSDALVRADVDSLVNMYTADALLIPPGAQLRGRDEIRGWFTQDTTWHNISHSTEAHELSVYDSVAIEYGTWRNTWRVGSGPEQSGSEKYVVFWKRGSDGQWRIHYDIWHFPPTSPPGAVIPAPRP